MNTDPLCSSRAIAVAPNGGRRGKTDHPSLPLSPAELAETAKSSFEAGAAMIHCHVRDREGRHLLDADAYRTAIAAIRKAVGPDLLVQITTEAVGIYGPDAQAAVVRETRPEAASLALAELVPDAKHEASFADLLTFMKRECIAPQIILYHPQEAQRLEALRKRGLIPFDDIPVLYVLGRYTKNQRSQPGDLLPFLASDMPHFDHFTVCAFGAFETACVTAAALFGGHVRVGFENNLHLPDGRTAPDNAALVAACARSLQACGLTLQSAGALRSAWGLEAPGKGR